MIVGMNGGGGLQAWSADGNKLWSANLGNVWNQAILSATRHQPARVFATEAGGSVRVFDAQGKPQATLRPNGGYYAQMAACRTTDKTIQIAAINGDKTVVFDETGKIAWTTSAIGNHGGWRTSSFAVGDIKGDGVMEWAFIDGSGNLVIATPNGQKNLVHRSRKRICKLCHRIATWQEWRFDYLGKNRDRASLHLPAIAWIGRSDVHASSQEPLNMCH